MSGSSLLEFDLTERRTLASTTFTTLVTALRSELLPMFYNGTIPIPEQKSRLTRIGGRCPFDGTLLSFDPWLPHEHHCPNCQRVFMGEEHHDWWAMAAQLWVAERAAQSAALYLLTDDNECLTLALRILKELAIRYRSWPNKDNALGPTRPFFSTYLESIWLINLCHSISLLEAAPIHSNARDILREVRELLVRPSRDLIATFHEGRSNRQVWNEVAILSASLILGEIDAVEKRLKSRSGLLDHFANGLLDDGTWYEGENYHLFAHRGLWYGVQLLQALNQPLSAENERRFRAGFVTPFLGVLPDDTLPSRRDSQYKVSIRQWRFAEWCELGVAHSAMSNEKPDQRLAGILHRLYDDTPTTDQQRHRISTADSERNEPAGAVSRASLSWRTLLMASAELPRAADWKPASICLPQQGLAVLRRNGGSFYVALEGGHTGGGHGHPDRLALTLQIGDDRILEDSGTGSYVEKKLHWYRSTLAHFAPLVNGASQLTVPAELVAYEDRGGAGWICKRVIGLAKGVNAQRTIVVADGYLIDFLEWEADHDCQIDLPLFRQVSFDSSTNWVQADPHGAGGLEDGFDFLTDVQSHDIPSQQDYWFHPDPSGIIGTVHYKATTPFQIWRAQAPLPPGHGTGELHWLRTKGRCGSITGFWNWGTSAPDLRTTLENPWSLTTTTAEGTVARHTRNETGWHIALTAGAATSSIELGGVQIDSLTLPAVKSANILASAPPYNASQNKSEVIELKRLSQTDEQLRKLAGHPIKDAVRFKLGHLNYVGTEQSWEEAEEPIATIQVGVTVHSLIIDVLARTGPIVIPNFHEENNLDNERRDVNADGVQIHVGKRAGEPWSAAWLVVPDRVSQPGARVTPITPDAPAIETHWALADGAWVMRCLIPLGDIRLDADNTFALEVIINERSSDRVRRRGQLVLSGGGGFGYLRGDRTDSAPALTFKVPPIVLTLV
ncbi:MAG: heparinase II/III family protein [Gemmatimonadaceae bacterium]